eukprot:969291-Prymnesium_polylepis.1
MSAAKDSCACSASWCRALTAPSAAPPACTVQPPLACTTPAPTTAPSAAPPAPPAPRVTFTAAPPAPTETPRVPTIAPAAPTIARAKTGPLGLEFGPRAVHALKSSAKNVGSAMEDIHLEEVPQDLADRFHGVIVGISDVADHALGSVETAAHEVKRHSADEILHLGARMNAGVMPLKQRQGLRGMAKAMVGGMTARHEPPPMISPGALAARR